MSAGVTTDSSQWLFDTETGDHDVSKQIPYMKIVGEGADAKRRDTRSAAARVPIDYLKDITRDEVRKLVMDRFEKGVYNSELPLKYNIKLVDIKLNSKKNKKVQSNSASNAR